MRFGEAEQPLIAPKGGFGGLSARCTLRAGGECQVVADNVHETRGSGLRDGVVPPDQERYVARGHGLIQ